MKVYKGSCASPGLVLGQVSRLEHHVETTTVGPFKPSRELQLLTDAIRTAQDELESMADRAAPSEQAIFQFQSMMLDDEGMMNEVRFCINAGIGAAAAMNQVGQRYADQLANMKDNPYMQLRSVDILDASRRVINIITNRPRMWLALDHPVILAAERLMPTDLFSVPSGMILGIITAEGSGQSHAAIIARAMGRRRSSASRITPTFSPRLLSTGSSAASRAVLPLPAEPLTASTAGCLKLSSAASACFCSLYKSITLRFIPSAKTAGSLLNAHKARLHFAVPLHGLAPHGGRTHPKPAFPVQGAVHHHFLFGLAVAGHAQHFVFVALEMPVAARLHMIFECFHVILFYTDTRHSGAECHIYNQYSIFQHGKKVFGRKDGEKGGRRRQKPGDRVGCLNCRATDAILKR